MGSLRIIRLMLDQARDTEEALAIFGSYNIDFSGGPPIHYLVADRGGRAAVIELKDGAVQIIRSDGPWPAATNFYLAGTDARARLRDAALDTALAGLGGAITPDAALGRRYDQAHTFTLTPGE